MKVIGNALKGWKPSADKPFPKNEQRQLDRFDEQQLEQYFQNWLLEKSATFMQTVGLTKGKPNKALRAKKLAKWEMQRREDRYGTRRPLSVPNYSEDEEDQGVEGHGEEEQEFLWDEDDRREEEEEDDDDSFGEAKTSAQIRR